MAQEIVRVEQVGFIKPPMHVAAMSPEEAAKGLSTTTMIFDKPVTLTVSHEQKIAYPSGVHEVPNHLADHWYLEANNVRPYNRPVAVTAQTPATSRSASRRGNAR
jgi:hypothetical protein